MLRACSQSTLVHKRYSALQRVSPSAVFFFPPWVTFSFSQTSANEFGGLCNVLRECAAFFFSKTLILYRDLPSALLSLYTSGIQQRSFKQRVNPPLLLCQIWFASRGSGVGSMPSAVFSLGGVIFSTVFIFRPSRKGLQPISIETGRHEPRV